MIALSIVVLMVLGTILGWYLYKASLRIQAWGRNMDEHDPILVGLSEPEEYAEFQKGYRQTGLNAGSASPLVSHSLPLGATTK